MFQQFSTLLDRLQQADFLSQVMEPILYLGIFFGLISFSLGFFTGDQKSRSLGLIIIALSCFSVYPQLKLYQKAAPRIASVSGTWTPSQVKAQMERRYSTRWVFYGMGWLSIVAVASSGGAVKFMGGTVIFVGTCVMFFGLWLHLKEMEIYHPYIKRSYSPPAAPASTPTHEREREREHEREREKDHGRERALPT